MATYNKFQSFIEKQFVAPPDWDAATVKVALSNTAPNVSTNDFFNDITEISAGNGYTAGGTATTITVTRSGGTLKVAGTDVTFTATGAVGPFQYAILYIDTGIASTSTLVAYWDYGTPLTLANGEQFIVDFDATNGIFQAS